MHSREAQGYGKGGIEDAVLSLQAETDEGLRRIFINKATTRVWLEVLVLFGAWIGSLLVLGAFDAFDLLYEFTRSTEAYELDEVILAALISPVFLSVYAFRRTQEARVSKRATLEAKEHVEHLLDQHRELIDRLRRQGQENRRFIHAVAHEINNPLTPIALTLAKLRIVYGDEAERDLQMIRRNLDRIGSMATDLMTGLQLDDPERLRRKDVALDALLDEVVRSYDGALTERGIRVEVDAESTHVRADRERLTQVVSNLLSNAMKAVEDGGTIRLEAKNRRRGVEVAVHDDGAGMTGDQVDALFRPFGRLDTYGSASSSGFGLGLWVCTQIVRAHGGRLVARSDGPGRGSTFSFLLPSRPVTRGRASREAPTPSRRPTGQPHPS